ncbi:MAG: YihY/virulence factor BrkB family protein [Gemmatimonadetes bacterium]|nr:YihY/virulence factor BrkB family protein [Gemmatimonadota bacterium]
MSDNNLFLLCGGLAFATLLCLVPLVFLIFFALEAILDVRAIAHLVNQTVDVLIPYPEEAEYLKEVLSVRVSGVLTFKKAYGASGLLILIVSASSLFSSMRTLLNAVFKIDHSFGEKGGETEPVAVGQVKNMDTPGRWIKFLYRVLPIAVGKLKDLTMVLLILYIFLLLVLALPILSTVIDTAPSLLHTYITYFYGLISLTLIFAVFLGLYWLLPYQKIQIKMLATGAFWAALLWKLIEWIFGYYLSHFASISYLYGAYVLLVVVALWIYFSAIIFIIGAQIAQLCRERQTADLQSSLF